MTQGATGDRKHGLRRGVRHQPTIPADQLLVDVVYLLAVMVLVVIAFATFAGTGTLLAGPVPLTGPAPGF